jgi:MOSC domain-containing protein YiiM
MESCARVEAVAGSGLVGDRYAGRKASGGGEFDGQVTLVSEEELREAAERLGAPIAAGSTRRNVTVAGLGRLPRDAGARLVLGAVVVEVTGPAEPCGIMEKSVGRGAKNALVERAGIRARILRSGTIAVGEAVALADGGQVREVAAS